MKLRRIVTVIATSFVLLALTAFANAPSAEIGPLSLSNNAPEPGVLAVLGIALATTGIVLRIGSKSSL
jgi:hypothetical protein